MRTNRVRLCLYLLAAGCLYGCVGTTQLNQGLVTRLRNRGPVPLSTTNPYLAANMFVASAVETSSIISGFIKHKGVPAAVEVQDESFSPLFLYFYYPKDREMYGLEESLGTWIIHGPNRIPPDKAADLPKLMRNQSGEALIVVEKPSDDEASNAPRPLELLPSSGPEPSRTPASPGGNAALDNLDEMAAERDKLYQNSFKSTARPGSPALTAMQHAAGGHPAETAPNGDVVHHVTYPGETLSVIARWYTDDRGNAGRLARINRISNPNSLQLGDTVVVPSYMVKNKNRLSEEGLKELTKASLDEKYGRH
jgi:hypothetical protein